MKSALVSTAYHEAGHAVMAFLLDVRVRSASIEMNEDSAGHVSCVSDLHREHPDYNVSSRTRMKIERDVMVMIAGRIAQRLYRRNSVRSWHGQHDYERAVNLLSYVDEVEEVINLHVGYLEARVRSDLRLGHHWRAVRAVARALLQRTTIRGLEVRSIIHDAIVTSPITVIGRCVR